MSPEKALSSRNFLVLGATGQVGSALLSLLGENALGLDYPQVDFTKPDDLIKLLEKLRPACVINAAAYTQVDKAETEEETAQLINAQAPGILAQWCAQNGQIPFLHYSTDYVFSGEGDQPWKEEDEPRPLNKYGLTKLAGEQEVERAGGKWLIFRTSWVYGPFGNNFVKTMLKHGAEKEELRIVNDQHGSPTYAPELAKATLTALKHAKTKSTFPSGIYHVTSTGVTTWFDFAATIFEEARKIHLPLKVKNLLPVTSAEYPTPARRPKNSRLSTDKARRILDISLPHWKTSLAECMLLLK